MPGAGQFVLVVPDSPNWPVVREALEALLASTAED